MKRYNFTNLLFLFKIEPMIRRFFIIFCLAFLTTCDDGDILTIDLDFDKELARCNNFDDSHLIYDTRNDPNEALILIFPKSTENDLLFTEATTLDVPTELTINETSTRFIYRTYNRSLTASDVCAVVPPSDLSIRENYEAANGGKVYVTSTIVDDDGDGVPTIFENRGEADANGDFPDAQDWDGDGIPDYLDVDDDDDNVKTINEIDNSDDDDDPTTNPMDTDGDGIFDYLDTDDDGDEVPTRLEDANGENGPGDDKANDVNGLLVPHYLNIEENTPYNFEDYNAFVNTYKRVVTTTFRIEDFDLEIFRSDVIDFGTLITELDIEIVIEEEEEVD